MAWLSALAPFLLSFLLVGPLHAWTSRFSRERHFRSSSLEVERFSPGFAKAIFNHMAGSQKDSKIVKGGRKLLPLWRQLQGGLTAAFQAKFPFRDRRLRTLIVVALGEPAEARARVFKNNFRALTRNAFGDVFHFALFHYQPRSLWRAKEWWFGDSENIVLSVDEPGCKAQFWGNVTEQMAKRYDYILLMDDDMDAKPFSWALYRSVLLALDPLVSCPGAVAREPGGRSSDIKPVRMNAAEDNFVIAREEGRSEIQAAFVSAKVWPAVLRRMGGNDLHSDWGVNAFYDVMALASAIACGQTSLVIVNASPMRHQNGGNLLKEGGIGRRSGCINGCGEGEVNCRPISEAELGTMAEGLREWCSKANSSFLAQSCTGLKVRTCRSHLADGHRKRRWSVLLDVR